MDICMAIKPVLSRLNQIQILFLHSSPLLMWYGLELPIHDADIMVLNCIYMYKHYMYVCMYVCMYTHLYIYTY